MKTRTPHRRPLLLAGLMLSLALIGGLFTSAACAAADPPPAADALVVDQERGDSSLPVLSLLMWIAPLFLLGAVTENKTIARQVGDRATYPVAASTTIYEGTLVFVTAAGYADDDTNTGANNFAGVAIAKADNSSGAAGDINVEVWRSGILELVGSGFVQADVGKIAYASDNFTVTTTYSAAAVRIGRVVEYVSSTKLRVAIVQSNNDGLEYAAVAASAAISNTTTQTAFDKAHTIPANSLRPGDVIRVMAQVIATATNSTDTLNVTARLGTTDVIATGAVDVANNDIAVLMIDMVVRTIGAGGTFVAAGFTSLGAAGSATAKPGLKASTTLDTTTDISVNVTATWSVASASNSCRLDVLNVQVLHKR